MADYSIRYRDASGKPYDNVQAQDEYGRYLDAGGNVLGNSGQYQDAGQWMNDPDQSWLDFIGMKSKDVGGAAYNALANITGALSPVGSSPEGNMALQVPPMVTGLVNSAKRIGSQGGFTGVEEFDAPLQQDLSNVVLSLYGGNAVAGLSKPRGALGAGAFKEQPGAALATAGEQPVRAYRGISKDRTRNAGETDKMFSSSDPNTASTYAINDHSFDNGSMQPVDLNFNNPLTVDAQGNAWYNIPYGAFGKMFETTDTLAAKARELGHDGLIVQNVQDIGSVPMDGQIPKPATTYAALQRGTVKSPLTGETLFSDNKPSIFGGALATAGEQPKGITAYHGAEKAGYLDEAQRRGILWGSDSPSVSSNYAFDPQYADTTPKYIGNHVWTNGPELYDRHVRDAESNGGSVAPSVTPLEFNFQNPLVVGDPQNSAAFSRVPYQGAEWYSDDLAKHAREKGHDGLIMQNVWDGGPPSTIYAALQRGTVKSPMTGETLFARGVPLPPQQDDNLPDWLKF